MPPTHAPRTQSMFTHSFGYHTLAVSKVTSHTLYTYTRMRRNTHTQRYKQPSIVNEMKEEQRKESSVGWFNAAWEGREISRRGLVKREGESEIDPPFMWHASHQSPRQSSLPLPLRQDISRINDDFTDDDPFTSVGGYGLWKLIIVQWQVWRVDRCTLQSCTRDIYTSGTTGDVTQNTEWLRQQNNMNPRIQGTYSS